MRAWKGKGSKRATLRENRNNIERERHNKRQHLKIIREVLVNSAIHKIDNRFMRGLILEIYYLKTTKMG